MDVATSVPIEAYFQQAIALARAQQAKATELRATVSLSRFCLHQGQWAEACQALVDLYRWFTKGFDTANLREAKLLLDKLLARM